MPNSVASAGDGPIVSRSAQALALSQSLRLFVGRGRRYSYKEVQRGAGIPARMLECYRQEPDHEDWRPIKPEELASLYLFLGPDFTTDYLERVAKQGAYWIPDGDGAKHDIAADLSESAAKVVRAATANDSAPDLHAVGTSLMCRGAQLRYLGNRGQGDLFGRAVA